MFINHFKQKKYILETKINDHLRIVYHSCKQMYFIDYKTNNMKIGFNIYYITKFNKSKCDDVRLQYINYIINISYKGDSYNFDINDTFSHCYKTVKATKIDDFYKHLYDNYRLDVPFITPFQKQLYKIFNNELSIENINSIIRKTTGI